MTVGTRSRSVRAANAFVRVKLCGFTRLEDAVLAESLGVDALGFNFWKGSKRFVSKTAAARIIRALSPLVLPVGVFVNATRRDIEETVERTGIRAIQLHGDERAADARGWKLPVIKAFSVKSAQTLKDASRFPCDLLLFDTPSPMRGGSGETFDWNVLASAHVERPYLLAGGLTPKNVRRAVRLLQPFGVDAASGVESAPGLKDARLIRQFLRAARAGKESR